jgi:hypothetical protein
VCIVGGTGSVLADKREQRHLMCLRAVCFGPAAGEYMGWTNKVGLPDLLL